MTSDSIREDARAHWIYTEGAIRAAARTMKLNNAALRQLDRALVLAKYVYNMAYFHGHKHGVDELIQGLGSDTRI